MDARGADSDRADGDLWVVMWDCDDTEGTAFPGATEVPGNDVDEDCDGHIAPAEDPPDPTDTGTPTDPHHGDGKGAPEGGCGCSSTGSGSAWLGVVALVLLRRRLPV